MGIKICPECNGKVSEGRDFCPHCGHAFPKMKRCPDCEELIAVDLTECPTCGYVFEKPEETEKNVEEIVPVKEEKVELKVEPVPEKQQETQATQRSTEGITSDLMLSFVKMMNAGTMIQDEVRFEKLLALADDEMNSEQYEEAADHFNKLHEMEPTLYLFGFLKAYCKSFLGVRRDVVPDAQTLSSAFESAFKKALANKDPEEGKLDCKIIWSKYGDAMLSLRNNAVSDADDMNRDHMEINNLFESELKNAVTTVILSNYKDKLSIIDLISKNDFEYPNKERANIQFLKDLYDSDKLSGAVYNAIIDIWILRINERKKVATLTTVIGGAALVAKLLSKAKVKVTEPLETVQENAPKPEENIADERVDAHPLETSMKQENANDASSALSNEQPLHQNGESSKAAIYSTKPSFAQDTANEAYSRNNDDINSSKTVDITAFDIVFNIISFVIHFVCAILISVIMSSQIDGLQWGYYGPTTVLLTLIITWVGFIIFVCLITFSILKNKRLLCLFIIIAIFILLLLFILPDFSYCWDEYASMGWAYRVLSWLTLVFLMIGNRKIFKVIFNNLIKGI